MPTGRKLKSLLVHAALVVVSLGVGLVLCELLLRSFVRVGSFRWVDATELRWNTQDEERDYVLTPGYSGRLQSPEFDNHVRINRMGFRGGERGAEPGDGTGPVFVLGDSFVFGVGAEEEEAIPARLAHHLALGGEPREVWNLGVLSHSSPQYRQTLEHYARLRAPGAVVVCLFMGNLPGDANDLWGAVTFEEQRASDREAAPPRDRVDGPSPKPTPSRRSVFRRLVKRLQRSSALYVLLAERVAPTARAWRHRQHRADDRESKRFERGWAILQRDLAAMSAEAASHRAELLVVHIPEASDVLNGHWQTLDRLQTLTDELDLPLVGLRRELPKDEVPHLYYPLDGHLTPAGYDRAAARIARALLDERQE